MSRLHASDLQVHADGRRILDGVSLEVGAGELVGLLGPNGAGKTTTFRALAGTLPLQAGTVSLDGAPLKGPLYARARRGLGYLPQEPTLFADLRVEQHLFVALEARGVPPEEAQGLLARLGIEHLAQSRPRELSGGECRRLEIARCLAVGATVLLLDEPFAGLDPRIVSELGQILRDLAAEGVGILLTDHAVREALALCDRVYLIDKGSILLQGTSRDVAEHPVARDRWLGEEFLSLGVSKGPKNKELPSTVRSLQ